MTAWTNDALEKIGAADELQLASRREDGTLRKPVTIWVVRRSDDLYVRAFKGRTSPWFRATQARGEGQIQAGDIQKDVAFVDPDQSIGDARQSTSTNSTASIQRCRTKTSPEPGTT